MQEKIKDDLVRRQAAIDALDGVKVDEGYCTEYEIGYNDGIDFAVSKLSVLPSAQPELSTEIQKILTYLDTTLHPIVSPDNWNVYAELHDMVSMLPSAQPSDDYNRGWEDGQNALREEQWENGRDRLD